MKTPQYRQGDVLLERIDTWPFAPDAKPVPLDQGKVILAYGEVTGHAHAFAPEEVEKFVTDDKKQFFKVKGRPLDCALPIVREWRDQVLVEHPEHGMIEFARRDVKIEDGRVVVKGDFSLLRHGVPRTFDNPKHERDHRSIGVAAGFYRGGGVDDTVRQREYSPTEARIVAD